MVLTTPFRRGFIILCPVVGSPSYAVAAYDLHPLHKHNERTKFADDPYLLVGSDTVAEELEKIKG